MAEFGTSFSGLVSDRKLTDAELVKAILFFVSAENEAIQLYMQQLEESTDNRLAVAALKDIADEERIHAGEFLEILLDITPDDKKYNKGTKVVNEKLKKM